MAGLKLKTDGWELTLNLSSGYEYPPKIWCEKGKGLQVKARGGQIASLEKSDDLYLLTLRAAEPYVKLSLAAG